mmetsp:Transcript_50070/g.160240  ORF Transcript_50070/g.160240 Transcript_50070/m.160240 type:complete len:186 (+) Transcript_50070:96-653(+)|eukprot:CAMPEP_0182867444 /NCGR_PEP_ID=MMETSP0034_2-20130328/8725_1 /TAXON_ID=156128 /ORGANISM="Nephroselmis pyriformis, Strain CCMP717" /LENGTH=185 /DNA_ID=CAMNT_0024999801 /DNA_START=87 /DNA_END=644 /DNA_ORIENTATION=+
MLAQLGGRPAKWGTTSRHGAAPTLAALRPPAAPQGRALKGVGPRPLTYRSGRPLPWRTSALAAGVEEPAQELREHVFMGAYTSPVEVLVDSAITLAHAAEVAQEEVFSAQAEAVAPRCCLDERRRGAALFLIVLEQRFRAARTAALHAIVRVWRINLLLQLRAWTRARRSLKSLLSRGGGAHRQA